MRESIFARTCVAVACAALIAGAAGCAAENEATVSGRVTLDGNPLDHGMVTFAPTGDEASGGVGGAIQEDGTYRVQIGTSGSVVSGEYSVAVVVRGTPTPRADGGPPIPGELITPEHYSRAAISGLRFNVRPGENVIDVALSSEGGRPVPEKPEIPFVEAEETEDQPAETEDDPAADTAEEEQPAPVDAGDDAADEPSEANDGNALTDESTPE